jgi:hypothetical protein
MAELPPVPRPSDAEVDASARILEREGNFHGWFPKGIPSYDDAGPIERSEFGGGVERILMAATHARMEAAAGRTYPDPDKVDTSQIPAEELEPALKLAREIVAEMIRESPLYQHEVPEILAGYMDAGGMVRAALFAIRLLDKHGGDARSAIGTLPVTQITSDA